MERHEGFDAALVGACRRLYDAIHRVDALAARTAAISHSDLRCLNLLEQGPRRPREIGVALGLTSGAVTAMIDRLERAGLARRGPDPRDRRGAVVAIAPEAFGRLGPLYGRVARAIGESAAGYDAAARAAALQCLADLAAAYEAAEAGGGA